MKVIVRELDLDGNPVEIEFDAATTTIARMEQVQAHHMRVFGKPCDVVTYIHEEGDIK